MVKHPPDADRQIDLRRNGPPADAHLQLMRQPAGMNRIAGRSQDRPHFRRHFPRRRQIFRAAQAHPHAHNHLGLGQGNAAAVLLIMAFPQQDVSPGQSRRRQNLDLRRCAVIRIQGRQQAGPQRNHIGQSLGQDGREDIAAQSRFQLYQPPLLVNFQVNGIAGQAQAQAGRAPGCQIPPVGRGGE